MNIRQNELRLTVELRQVTDAVECVFHSLLLHRTLGRFQYNDEKTFSIGSIGIQEVNCEQIDMTYTHQWATDSKLKATRLSKGVRGSRKLLERLDYSRKLCKEDSEVCWRAF
ncbi:hypothetical protein B9Z55_016047 [Caenorhabditis nigoni]|uniref:Autophagy-related protein 101 n=1 Tax=Caenorhabditis nigoni TaxID=1611254 RepID=A0A2G5UD12_9PELO|nr:hypothetical protein B9Z55_016047 [Caenorhabditis nigoni]